MTPQHYNQELKLNGRAYTVRLPLIEGQPPQDRALYPMWLTTDTVVHEPLAPQGALRVWVPRGLGRADWHRAWAEKHPRVYRVLADPGAGTARIIDLTPAQADELGSHQTYAAAHEWVCGDFESRAEAERVRDRALERADAAAAARS